MVHSQAAAAALLVHKLSILAAGPRHGIIIPNLLDLRSRTPVNSMKTFSASCEQIEGVTASITGTFQVLSRVALLGQGALAHILTAQQRVSAS